MAWTSKNCFKSRSFKIAIDYLEGNDDETMTLNDLYDVMKIKVDSLMMTSIQSLI